MKKLRLKRSDEYKKRLRYYSKNVKQRYGNDVASYFLDCAEAAEDFLTIHYLSHKDQPYIVGTRSVVLKEHFFDSGPVWYCIVYEVFEKHVGLLTLWHAIGSRQDSTATRIWPAQLER